MSELILGTVQLGLDYGINNVNGKPSLEEAYKILNTAYDNGIKILDTASAYGDSEKVIGSFMRDTKKYFKIATKLPKLNSDELLEDQVRENIQISLNRLGVNKIECYLYHNFQDTLKYRETLKTLDELKYEEKIGKVGISIYDMDEIEYILNNLAGNIDIIQLPFNVLDTRWINGDWLKKTKDKGIEIAVRSVFLQGLFFLKKEKADIIHPNTYEYIKKIRNLSSKKNITVEEFLLSYVKSIEEINYILIGCDNNEQLYKNILNFNKDVYFSNKEISNIAFDFKNVEKKIIDPRMW